MADTLYTAEFFDDIEQGSLTSARTVVPLLIDLVQPRRILDVGCGRGAWLSVFQDYYVEVVKGIDGPHVDRTKLLIDKRDFAAVDLSRPFTIDGQFDLALCLEVAEHLPQENGPALVSNLTSAAPLVLFSAAVPGQHGTHHINLQWPSYWSSLFEDHGFRRLDPIRRKVWYDQRVQWWYRQNMLLYASDAAIRSSEALQEEERLANNQHLEVLHADILQQLIESNARGIQGYSARTIAAALPQAVFRAIKSRIS